MNARTMRKKRVQSSNPFHKQVLKGECEEMGQFVHEMTHNRQIICKYAFNTITVLGTSLPPHIRDDEESQAKTTVTDLNTLAENKSEQGSSHIHSLVGKVITIVQYPPSKRTCWFQHKRNSIQTLLVLTSKFPACVNLQRCHRWVKLGKGDGAHSLSVPNLATVDEPCTPGSTIS